MNTSTANQARLDADVFIVGGGPVGLSMAILLERFGLSYVLVEKSPTTTTHPKARGAWPRTMELLRQWGVESAVRKRGIADDADVFAFVESIAGHEFGRTRPEQNVGQTPAWKVICSQDVVEEELLRITANFKHGRILYSNEFVGLENGAEFATITTRSVDTGETREWRTRYVVAADGAGSPVRRFVDIDMRGPSKMAIVANDYWKGDLSVAVAGANHVAGYRIWPKTPGMPPCSILNANGKDRWLTLMAIEDDPAATRAPWSDEEVVRMARSYSGIPNLQAEVINRSVWRLSRQVAATFRKGRVFLVGDAAHRFPPNGGFGMNSGIQDAHNLAWKFKYVLTGLAGEALLDTYDMERRPIGESNADFSYGNFLRYGEADRAVRSGNVDRINFWIRDTEHHLHSAGQGLGFSYDEGALVPDGTIKTPLRPRYYEPSDRPGGRFPHMWLDLASRHSTLDWFDKDFVVVTGPRGDEWLQAAKQVSEVTGLNVAAHRLDAADPRDGLQMGARGAVLVRPDGHVAFRMPWTPADPTAELAAALSQVLRRSVS